MKPNLVLDFASFGRWRLRDKAAQGRWVQTLKH
jgi:hypothetical protein